MFCRPPASRLLGAFLLAWIGWSAAVLATPPKLVSAVSRMTHGAAGAFDVQLPLSGGSGIECRDVARGMTLILKFDQPITRATPRLTAGVAMLGNPAIATNSITLKLTGLKDAQSLVLNLSNVRNAAGETLASVDLPFRVLKGDLDATGGVNATDVALIKAAVLKKATVRGDNFRGDVNVDGRLTIDDVTLVQAGQAKGGGVEGRSTTNTSKPKLYSLRHKSTKDPW